MLSYLVYLIKKQVIHPGFETHVRCDQKSNTGGSVTLEKGVMSFKKFWKKEFSET